MHQQLTERSVDLDPRETAEWLEALDQIVEEAGSDRVNYLLSKLTERARENGVKVPLRTTTDYINTIRTQDEVPYPGDRALERRLPGPENGSPSCREGRGAVGWAAIEGVVELRLASHTWRGVR